MSFQQGNLGAKQHYGKAGIITLSVGFGTMTVIISLMICCILCGKRSSHQQRRPIGGEDGAMSDECRLSRSVFIESLPTFAYHKSDTEDNTADVQCAICLGSVEDEEMVRQLPNCKHLFHVECVDMWLYSHSTCPYCRAEALPINGSSMTEESATSAVHPLPPV